MDSPQCSKCGQLKPSSLFYKRKTGERAGKYYEKCIDCMKERGRKYYHSNHDRQLELAILRRHKAYKIKRDFINAAKNRPCADCGEIYPFYVMDFDHKDARNKVRDVANLVSRNWSLEKIKSETGKCDVVCANCHRKRTYKYLAEVAKVVTAGL